MYCINYFFGTKKYYNIYVLRTFNLLLNMNVLILRDICTCISNRIFVLNKITFIIIKQKSVYCKSNWSLIIYYLYTIILSSYNWTDYKLSISSYTSVAWMKYFIFLRVITASFIYDNHRYFDILFTHFYHMWYSRPKRP